MPVYFHCYFGVQGWTTETIGGTASTTFNNLTIDNTSGLVPPNGVTLVDANNLPKYVNGVLTLTLGKVISKSTSLLTLNANATVNNSPAPSNSSYVYGPVAKVIANNAAPAFVFPVGKDSAGSYAEYLPIGIGGFNGGGTMVTFTAEVMRRNIDPIFTPSSPSYVETAPYDCMDKQRGFLRILDNLTQPSVLSLNAQITAYWNSNFCLVTNPSSLRIVTINSAPTTWSDIDNYNLG